MNPIPMARMIVDAEPFDYVIVVGEDGEPRCELAEDEEESDGE